MPPLRCHESASPWNQLREYIDLIPCVFGTADLENVAVLIIVIKDTSNASNESPGRFKCVQDATRSLWSVQWIARTLQMRPGRYKVALKRPKATRMLLVALQGRINATNGAKTRLLASNWIRTPLYLSTVLTWKAIISS